ncbi:calcineurin catalytic subunit A [Pelomyxa schiedti]|nr:calcineurin catalytic subunit A [Pelomyxa schiedti]
MSRLSSEQQPVTEESHSPRSSTATSTSTPTPKPISTTTSTSTGTSTTGTVSASASAPATTTTTSTTTCTSSSSSVSFVAHASGTPSVNLDPLKPIFKSMTVASLGAGAADNSMRREMEKRGKLAVMPRPVGDDRVIKSVDIPETRALESGLLFCGEGDKPALGLLRNHLAKEGRLEKTAALKLIAMGTELLATEPNMLSIEAPVVICGDIHGQFYDLMTFMELAGSPSSNKFLFLGDYVDRGDFSTEVVFYLIALKINFPDSVFLLRGNHESRLMCEYMTFCVECEHKYDPEVYSAFAKLFDNLPLAALLTGNLHGPSLCMHGGLGPKINTLDDIRRISRFSEPPQEGPLCDIIWSDPVNEWDPSDPDFEDLTLEEWQKITFYENVPRHTSYFFGRAAIEPFLQRNGLACIIRGHQVQDLGYMQHFFGVTERALPMVYTVFSAPNYCDQYGNMGALMRYTSTHIGLEQFQSVPHPYNLPDFIDCFTYSLPFMLEQIVMILQKLVIQMRDMGPDLSPEEQAADDDLRMKCQKLFAASQRQRAKVDVIKRAVASYTQKMSQFKRVLQLDMANEAAPRPVRITKKPSLKRNSSAVF